MTLAALRRGDLAGARELRLGGGLTEVPDEILGLADTLEVLDLGGNPLSELPPWFARLRRLRVLFCSNTRFEVLPPVLGELPELSQVGFRRTGLREVPAEALPPRLRWLTLTDNRIERLPDAIGDRPGLRKLMLAGNRLGAAPEALARIEGLELLRLSANALEEAPAWLARMPALAWLAAAANPFEPAPVREPVPALLWSAVSLGELLGEGASGRAYAADLAGVEGETRTVCVKLFRGAMTSDGLPEHELAASLAAGEARGLAGAIGWTRAEPGGELGLVMARLPPGARPLAEPPDAASCTRDVYAEGRSFAPGAVLRIVADVASAAAHLHTRGLMHGDLYAHNVLWDAERGTATLTDLGAASFLPDGPTGEAWARFDVLAWGRLASELLARCPDPPPQVRELAVACSVPEPRLRPAMAEVTAALG